MGLDRRSFLMFVLGGAAGGLFTPMMWKPLDDVSIWTQNWPWIPRLKYGALNEKSTVIKMGAAEYGANVQTVDGRPVAVYGNEDHPLSQGGVDALGAAGVQMLYSPSRVAGPMVKNGDSFESVSWKDAQKLLGDKLKAAGSSVACISGDETSSANDVLAGLLAGLGSSDYYFMPNDSTTMAAVWQDWMGGSGQVGFDVENADYVLALGADVLENWGAYVQNAAVFGKGEATFVYAGPSKSGTAYVADSWVPVAPGKSGHLALSIAYYLVRAGNRPSGVNGFEAFEEFVLSEYSPDKAEKKTGLPAGQVRDLAKALYSASRPVVITGALAAQGASGFDLMAGMGLNLLLDRINKPGGVTVVADAPSAVEGAPSSNAIRKKSLMAYLESGAAPKVLLVYEANPVFALPQQGKSAAAIEKIPFKVSFSTYMDETAAMADLILPNPHFLERVDDSYTPFGASQLTYTVGTPLVDPAFDVKPAGDVVLAVAKGLGVDLGYRKYEDVVEAKAKALKANWRNLRRGRVHTAKTQLFQSVLSIWNDALPQAAMDMGKDDGALALAVTAPVKLGSRNTATPPGALLAIRENELQEKYMFVQMNSATAKNIGVVQGDMVKLSSTSGEIQAKVTVFEGVMPGVVVAPLGLGHTAWDEYVRGRGDNVYKLLTAKEEAKTGVYQWSDTRVQVAKI